MKLNRTTKISLIPLFVAAIGSYLFWPLVEEEKYRIKWDEELIESKDQYLQSLKSNDSIRRPNVIVMMADDLGKAEVSAYGNSRVPTPNIDAIGANGVIFKEGYVTSAICSPSRAGLLTGRYQQRFGYEVQPHDRYPRNMLEFYGFKYFVDTDGWNLPDLETISYPAQEDIDKQGLPPSEITLAELLQAIGYKTAMVGKWHLGYGDHALPHNRGFEHAFGFYEAFSWYFNDVEQPDVVSHHHDLFIDPYIWGKERTGTSAITLNGEEVIVEEYLTDRIARESVEFIDKNAESPFFLYIPFNAPHTPFQVSKKYYDRFPDIEDVNKRVYYGMISAMDDAVGSIIGKLRDEQLEENTIIFFLSDNGGATYTQATTNAPLKGGKMSDFEGGLNIPFLAQWKGTIPEGQTYDEPISSLDIFATAVGQAGIQLPTDRTYDGIDLVPYLTQEKEGTPHEALFWRAEYNKIIRKGEWKLIMNDLDDYELLYNLSSDKNETTNVVEQFPDVVSELKGDFEAWDTTLAKPLWPRIMDYDYVINGENYSYSN